MARGMEKREGRIEYRAVRGGWVSELSVFIPSFNSFSLIALTRKNKSHQSRVKPTARPYSIHRPRTSPTRLMQSAIEPPPSPTSSPERPDNGVPIQKTTSRGSASGRGEPHIRFGIHHTHSQAESMSLKRGRERSLVSPLPNAPASIPFGINVFTQS